MLQNVELDQPVLSGTIGIFMRLPAWSTLSSLFEGFLETSKGST